MKKLMKRIPIVKQIIEIIEYFKVLFLVLDSINDKLENIEKTNKEIASAISQNSNHEGYIRIGSKY